MSSFHFSYGLLSNGEVFYSPFVPRNADVKQETDYLRSYRLPWNGEVAQFFISGRELSVARQKLPARQYRIRYLALKNLAMGTNPSDFDVYVTPPFDLVY